MRLFRCYILENKLKGEYFAKDLNYGMILYLLFDEDTLKSELCVSALSGIFLNKQPVPSTVVKRRVLICAYISQSISRSFQQNMQFAFQPMTRAVAYVICL